MENDSSLLLAPIVAATLTAAVFSKIDLPKGSDPTQEILRIYRQTLRRVEAEKSRPKAVPAHSPAA